jgi:hypothetical protein
MYYKHTNNTFDIVIGNPEIFYISDNGHQLHGANEALLNTYELYKYESPTITEYQSLGELTLVNNKVTHTVIDKSVEEVEIINTNKAIADKLIQYNWEHDSTLSIRITIDYTLIERDIYGNAAPLTHFADNLIKRKAIYNYYSETRTYIAYLKYFNADELLALQSHPSYNTWITNGDLLIEDFNLLP